MTNKNRGRWTEAEDKRLANLWGKGMNHKEIASVMGRTQASVNMRLSKLRKKDESIERRGKSKGYPAGRKQNRKKMPETLPTGKDANTKARAYLLDPSKRPEPEQPASYNRPSMYDNLIKRIESENDSLRARINERQHALANCEEANHLLRGEIGKCNQELHILRAEVQRLKEHEVEVKQLRQLVHSYHSMWKVLIDEREQ